MLTIIIIFLQNVPILYVLKCYFKALWLFDFSVCRNIAMYHNHPLDICSLISLLYISLRLTCCQRLLKLFGLPLFFTISVHDEVFSLNQISTLLLLLLQGCQYFKPRKLRVTLGNHIFHTTNWYFLSNIPRKRHDSS